MSDTESEGEQKPLPTQKKQNEDNDDSDDSDDSESDEDDSSEEEEVRWQICGFSRSSVIVA